MTFRLADSLPRARLRQLEDELARLPREQREMERRKRIEAWLDAGMGGCALGEPAMAVVVRDALLHRDGERYRLIAWCVMPNHVHVVLRPCAPLGGIVRSWKSYTAGWASKNRPALRARMPEGAFWMRDYWDRYMRDAEHLETAVRYVHRNPVEAGLCRRPGDWPWSSAGKGEGA